MNFTVPASARQSLYQGSTFFDLQRGVDAYNTLRIGDVLEGTCGEAKLKASVDSVGIGPLGQFFQPGTTHVSSLGRGFDVRALTDAVEAKDGSGDPKAVDPREIYTSIQLRVVSVSDPTMPMPSIPTMPGMPVA